MSEKIYEDLKRQYDLVAERRKILTNQAANLMGFTGIINTVLIGLMVSVATNNEVRSLLLNTPYYPAFIGFAASGFLSYVSTAIFALFAYWEPKWILAPEVPYVRSLNGSGGRKDLDSLKSESLEFFLNNPDLYDRDVLTHQLHRGMEDNQKVNNKKYGNIKLAFVALIVGIGATTIGGIILISTAL